MSDEKQTDLTASTETPSSPPPAASGGGKGPAPTAKVTAAKPAAAAAPLAPAHDENQEYLAAPSVFKIEKRNKLHQQVDRAKSLGPRKVEIIHGTVLCGNAVRDKQYRNRISEDKAYVGDVLTLPGEDAVMLVRNGIAKFADLPAQV